MALQSYKYIFLAYICIWIYFEVVMIDISSAQSSNNDTHTFDYADTTRDNNKSTSTCDELAAGKSQCPDGWHVTSNPRTCIKLSKPKTVSWSQVLNTCAQARGNPVSLYTTDTRIAHQRLLNESITLYTFWTGVRIKNGIEYWNNKKSNESALLLWNKNQHKSLSEINDACVSIRSDATAHLSSCTSKKYFICAHPLLKFGRKRCLPLQDPCFLIEGVMRTVQDSLNYCLKDKHEPKYLDETYKLLIPYSYEVYNWLFNSFNDNYFLKLLPNSTLGHGEKKTCFGIKGGIEEKYDCKETQYHMQVLCERNSEDGPYTFPEVTIDFPRPYSTAFLNNSLTLKCSTYGPRDQGLTWTARVGIDRVYFQNVTIRRVQEMITSGDRCRYYTTVTYDIVVDEFLDGAILTCFSYNTSNKFTCNEILGESYCKSSELIKAIRGPERPNLTVNYDHSPAIFIHGSIMVLECLGYVALEQVMTWVKIHRGRTKVITHSDESVIELTESIRADPEHGYWMFSLLKIQAHTDLSGIAFACYTEDAILYAKDGLECPSPHVRCTRTERIRILGTTWSMYKYLLPLLFLFFLLVGVLFLKFYPDALPRGEFSNESLEKEHPPTVASDYADNNQSDSKDINTGSQVDPVDISTMSFFNSYKLSEVHMGSVGRETKTSST